MEVSGSIQGAPYRIALKKRGKLLTPQDWVDRHAGILKAILAISESFTAEELSNIAVTSLHGVKILIVILKKKQLVETVGFRTIKRGKYDSKRIAIYGITEEGKRFAEEPMLFLHLAPVRKASMPRRKFK